MSPVPFSWGPFLAKNFLKIDEIKIRPLTPPPRIISIHYLYWLLTRVYRKVGKIDNVHTLRMRGRNISTKPSLVQL